MITESSVKITVGMQPAVDWLPTPGHYGRVPMQNRLSDLKPVPPVEKPEGYGSTWTWGSIFKGNIEHYAGAAFNPDYSPLGAWMIGCGGGNSWWGNNVTVGDLSTLQYSILVQPSPWALSDAYEYRTRNTDPDWRDYPDHSPITSHNYTGPQCIPASWGVTGPRGAYLLACHTWHNGRYKAHKVLVDDPNPHWERASDRFFADVGSDGTATIASSYPAATRDDVRQCFYMFGARQDGTSHHWKLTKDGVLTQEPGGIGVYATVSCIGYSPDLDILVSVGSHEVTTRVTLRVIDPETWASAPMTFVGPRPTYAGSNGSHPEWYPSEQCFVFWDAYQELLYKLFPPASGDLLTGTWEFTSQKLNRSTEYPPVLISSTHAKNAWNKLRYIPALQALLYVPTLDDMHIIKP